MSGLIHPGILPYRSSGIFIQLQYPFLFWIVSLPQDIFSYLFLNILTLQHFDCTCLTIFIFPAIYPQTMADICVLHKIFQYAVFFNTFYELI